MLYGRRKRIKEIEDAEAEGQSFWTEKLDESARYKILYAVEGLSPGKLTAELDRVDLVELARKATLADLGLPSLAGGGYVGREDALVAILDSDEDIVLSFLEALIRYAGLVADLGRSRGGSAREDGQRLATRSERFVETLKTVLREHRLSLDLVDGQFVPFESREMHEAVVIPTLTLLGGRKDLEGVEAAYRAALDEIHTGSPQDAITDAATALQEALSALGCEGNALGPLAQSAVKQGIITKHDRKLIDWISADRATKGDAHNAQEASREDAWLAVHVAGALILRITGGPLRESET